MLNAYAADAPISSEKDDDELLFPPAVPNHTGKTAEDDEVAWQKDVASENKNDVPRALLSQHKAILAELAKSTAEAQLDDFSMCARLPWKRQRVTSETDFRAHIVTTSGLTFTLTLVEVYRFATNFVRRHFKLPSDSRLDLFLDPSTQCYAVRWDKPKVLETLRLMMTPPKKM